MTTKNPASATKKKPTKAEMRVAIAKDVIKQLNAGKLLAKTGNCYVEFKESDAKKFNPEAQLQKELKNVKKCTVCALGGMFISAVSKFNDVTVGQVGLGKFKDELGAGFNEFVCRDDATDKLSTWFSDEQLDDIEEAFEYAKIYYHKISSAKKRLETIMTNIIENKGTFVLPQPAEAFHDDSYNDHGF